MRKHFMYGAWAGMVNRCHNPNNASFARYGGRGTTVCDRWRKGEGGKSGFECFLADMGERPAGMTLDRQNANGNYEPGNCRWADARTQRVNLSDHGRQEMSRKISEAKTRAWQEWREGNTVRIELTRSQQMRLLGLLDRPHFTPDDGRQVKTFDALVGMGFAVKQGDSYEITNAGRDWISGGRPSTRYSPTYLRRLAASLEI